MSNETKHTPMLYTLAQIRNGTGFEKGARFIQATPETLRACNSHAKLVEAAEAAENWLGEYERQMQLDDGQIALLAQLRAVLAAAKE